LFFNALKLCAKPDVIGQQCHGDNDAEDGQLRGRLCHASFLWAYRGKAEQLYCVFMGLRA
jgi:hypothetical protein